MPNTLRKLLYADNEAVEGSAGAAETTFTWSWNWVISSRSPLDDILRSFESTRRLTRPLSFRRPSTEAAFASDGSEVSDVDSERTLRADEDVLPKDEDSRADVDVDVEKGMSLK